MASKGNEVIITHIKLARKHPPPPVKCYVCHSHGMKSKARRRAFLKPRPMPPAKTRRPSRFGSTFLVRHAAGGAQKTTEPLTEGIYKYH